MQNLANWLSVMQSIVSLNGRTGKMLQKCCQAIAAMLITTILLVVLFSTETLADSIIG